MPVLTEELDSSGVPRLKRVLSVWDLAFYGVVAVTPSAPATVFGLAQVKSHGHAVDTLLVAMVAMVLTAISYGRMAALYPSAGSAYTYVGRGLHPYLGFVAGWAMLLDYVVSPVFCVMFGTFSLMRSVPALPFPLGAAVFAGGITYLNLRGIRSTVRTNQILIGFMFVVLLAYVVLAIRFLAVHQGVGGLFSIKPFYNAATFNVRDIASATSFAALAYLGFDAVTTLAEDVKNPRRNVMLAAVGVCVFRGAIGRTPCLSGAAGLAGLQHLFERGDGIHRGHRAGRWNCVVSRHGDPAVGGHDRRRADHPGWGSATVVRHGPG